MSLQQAWLHRGALARLLWPISLIYGALFALRQYAYRRGIFKSERGSIPVLVVGNVIAGGAGKTPVVIALVQHLRARGLQVGVVSRGYGRRTDDCREATPQADPRDVGDEPALVRRATGVPVFVARRRAEAARALAERYPQTQLIVSDDGLQHLALARACEICVFDDRGTGNGWLLPAGPLREPWPRPCDLILHTGAHPAFEGYRAQRVLADHALGHDGQRVPLGDLVGRPVMALAAIAQPEAFFAMLRARGVMLQQCIALPDHFSFDNWTPPAASDVTVVCTEKDAVKLWRTFPRALALPLVFTPEAAFFAALDAKLSFIDGHQAA